jgi:hypothetical protein
MNGRRLNDTVGACIQELFDGNQEIISPGHLEWL